MCQSPKFLFFEGAVHVDDSYNTDVNFIWSDQTQIKMGFVNPLTKKFYVHGTEINRHIHIPLVISYKKIEYYHRNTNVFIMVPRFGTKNERIVHLATRPYTGILDLFLVEPAVKNESTPNIQPSDSFFDGRFHVKLISDQNVISESYLQALKPYFFPGPFGEAKSSFNVFEIFFHDLPKHRTSLTAELDLPNTKSYATRKEDNSSFVEEQKLFEVALELSGPKTRSVALESLFEFERHSRAYRFTAKGSYWENNEKLYEALFVQVSQKSKQKIFAQDQRIVPYGAIKDTIEISSKFSFGKTLEDGNFISAESEIIDPVSFAMKPDEVFNVTVDFHGLPTQILKEVCRFDGDVIFKKLVASNIKVIKKNPGKCIVDDWDFEIKWNIFF